MKYFALASLAGIGAGVFVACAPIDEESCRAGNWIGIGVNDGKNGALTSRFTEYRKECAQYGIAPNQSEWLEGREIGLKTYCTPHSAYNVGTQGRELNNVCSNMDALIAPNKVGLRYDAIEDRIDELDDRGDEIVARIRTEFSGELTPDQYRIRRQYERLLEDIEDQIDDLKDEQRALPRY